MSSVNLTSWLDDLKERGVVDDDLNLITPQNDADKSDEENE